MRLVVFAAASAAVLGFAGLAQAADTCKAQATYQPAPSFDTTGLEDRDHWVTVSYRVDAEGRTTEVRVREADAADAFRTAAVKAVKSWRFDTQYCDLDHARVREATLRYWPVAGKGLRAAVNPELPSGPEVGEGDASATPVVVDRKAREMARRQGKRYDSERNEPGYVLDGR
ncbi:energy transducer TonB [Caulobacter sp. 17J65-9]|uniref:energy transducer TonB n=1 Tax=Caulobacter sp. 17J65-9 TaxID=2709382 RepID=UPI0013CD618E|nr:energy transducer TonB [Caulobacter sp. 17J65-9]NEX92020.1 energy transducer TonB [Caulobacter sp. 17J65-9]